MIFDAFDRIRIINLAERRDRRAQMTDELARVGLADDPRVAFFPGIRPADRGNFGSVGARGVYQGQLQILTEAAAAGESVLILEDDCDFAGHVRDYRVPAPWDIFYGGFYAATPDDLVNSDIVGAHMMGFSARGARLVSDYLAALQPDVEHPPIDGAYIWFRRAYPDVPTVFAEPPLANQRSSRTDIAALCFYDRWPVLRDAAGAARRLKRAISRARRSQHIRSNFDTDQL